MVLLKEELVLLKKVINDSENIKVLLVANVSKEHVLKFHIPTIKMLKEMGWKIDVACSGIDKVPYCDTQYIMSYKRSPFNLALLKGIKELKKIVDENDYNIVYCHTPVGGLVARIASIKARRNGTKVIYFAHGYHFFKGAPKLNWLLYYPMEKILSYMTDSIMLINKEDYELTKKNFKKCKVYLMDGIGVDTTRFKVNEKQRVREKYREKLEIPQDATVLIYMAELLKNKNQKFLMCVLKEVLKKNENVYLLLAGIDHSKGQFEKYASEINVKEHIRFLGWREDVGNLYATADICTPTSIREGFGLNLVEAMACGLPIVATRNRGHETIIRDGENGFLVELGNEEIFSNRILQLMNDKKLREKFIEVGKSEQSRYSSETVLENIRTVLEEHIV